MRDTAHRISTRRKANITPMASASMEVATASISITIGDKDGSQSSSSPATASRIMPPPIRTSRAKAIQWSTDSISPANADPSSQPAAGISA